MSSDQLNCPWDQFNWFWPKSLGEKPQFNWPGGKFNWFLVREFHSWSWSSTQLKKLNSAEEVQLSWRSSTQLKKLNSAEEVQLSWKRSTAFQQEHSLVLNPNNSHTQCWGLFLKCYKLRTRQHKNRLMVNALRPSEHYFLKDITIFGRRLWRTYLHHHNIYEWKTKHMKHEK
jgi:hypothetical protein